MTAFMERKQLNGKKSECSGKNIGSALCDYGDRECACYLVIGSDKAMLFDIGYGYENIMPLVRTITDLPVMLVLSHGDPDHGLGSKWFDEV